MIVPQPPAAAVAFVDAQHGWVGDHSALLATTNGRRFRLAFRAPIVAVQALDRSHAWALTGDGFVLRTTDGRRWSRLGAPHLFSAEFVDTRNGFGLTRDGVVVRSGDGGRSWPQLHTPGLMQAQCFSSTRDGWVSRSGSVWTTHDGGARWTRTRLGNKLLAETQPALECSGSAVWLLLTGGAAAGSQGYEVLRSVDGGRSWRAILAGLVSTHLPRISAYSGPFAALGGAGAIFEGSCSPCGMGTITFVRTVDGGRTFSRASPFDGYFPGPISFVDERRGWLLTAPARGKRREFLFATSDGGRHWHRVATIP